MTDDSFVLSPPVLPRPLLIEQIYLSIYIVFNIYIIIYNKLFYIHILSLRGEGSLFETVICHRQRFCVLTYGLKSTRLTYCLPRTRLGMVHASMTLRSLLSRFGIVHVSITLRCCPDFVYFPGKS